MVRKSINPIYIKHFKAILFSDNKQHMNTKGTVCKENASLLLDKEVFSTPLSAIKQLITIFYGLLRIVGLAIF